jgi:hypothetical protein
MPLNPMPPEPTVAQKAVFQTRVVTYRYRHALRTILFAAAFAVLLVLVGVPAASAAAGAVAFLLGAYVHGIN